MSDADSLRRLFLPESVAVVGATDTPGRVGQLAFGALRSHFAGEVTPINPRRTEVMGVSSYKSVSDMESVPDLVIVAVPASDVLSVAKECVGLGVGGLVVFGSGFAEAGADGTAMQTELEAVLRRGRTRLLGPNTLGFFDARRSLRASFLFAAGSPAPRPGPLALITQSGGFGEQLLVRAEEAGIGLGWMISSGNEMDVNAASCIDFLLTRDEAEVIAIFAEAIKEPSHFVAAVERARAADRPIVMIKTGRSAAGARATVTHTASMAGSDRVFQQVCSDLGVARVDTLDDVVDVARVLVSGRRMRGRRLGIVSASGGGGVLASDLADDAALAVPLLSIAVQDEVMRHIPPFGTPANPIDVTGQGPENRHDFAHVLDTIALSGEVDAVMCVFSSHGPIAVSVAETIAGAYERSGIPFVASWGSPDIAALDVFHAAGLPAYRNPRNAINALSAAATLHSPWTRSAGSTIEHPPHRSADCALCSDNSTGRLVLEAEAQQFLVQYGVVAAASREARGRDEAIAAAEELGYPLVLKLIAEQVPHREKAGAISFNVCSAAAVAHEFTRLTDLAAPGTVCSVLVAEQLPRGVEVMVGASRDREWGTTVLVGIGGSHAELIDRSALRLSPLSTTAAASAVREVFLDHLDADAVDAVARVASGVARAMDDHPHIESIDINPLIITPGGPVAVDALIATTPTDHIAI